MKRARSAAKGVVSLRTLNIFMIVMACVLAFLLMYVTFRTAGSYGDLRDATERYIACQKDAAAMMDGSDYLTEQARAFVVTGAPESVWSFFEEISETRRRDQALEDLGAYFEGTETYTFLETALSRSNELVQREYYAMRLAVEARGLDPADFPPELQTVQLRDEDVLLSAEEQAARAIELVFGATYEEQKAGIRADVSRCLDSLIEETKLQQAGSADRLLAFLREQTALIVVLLVSVLAIVLLTSHLVIRPLERGVELIREHKTLPVKGSSELQFLAAAYNTVFDQTRRDRDRLSYEASHDDLTGLYNRGVFEKMRETLDPARIALILADVDEFKTVNDTYGHDVGDRVLKKVAAMLQSGFRGEDYVCRIGGDEFAILMVNVTSALRTRVQNKLDYANNCLQHPDDGLPAVSLSIGVAFGDREAPAGDLYKDADTALYRVKQSGRSGCAFFG